MTEVRKYEQGTGSPAVRRHRDPVTGEMVEVVLDGVQLGLEAILRAVEYWCAKQANNADSRRLLMKLGTYLPRMLPHTDSELISAESAIGEIMKRLIERHS